MIKLATVFSGIGAVEHALNRMGIDTEIVFACDNGDIDIFSKKIPINIDEISIELKSLNSTIKKINFNPQDSYESQLLSMLNLAESEYDKLKDELELINTLDDEKIVIEILNTILQSADLNNQRVKLYNEFVKSLTSNSSINQKRIFLYQIISKVINDFKKDNSLDDLGNENADLRSSLNINWSKVNIHLKLVYDHMEQYNGKKIITHVRNLSKTIGQLHGKINSYYHLNKVNNISSYNNKKQYVENLYGGNERRNKVKISYMENYDCPKEHFHWDVSFLDGHQYRNQVDLFVGGSPCQSFSIMGKQYGLSDTRGTLFYEYVRLVDEIQPKVFIYENVRAVLNNDCGRTWEIMKDIFEQLNYNVFYMYNDEPSILNAMDYGIPQNRKRLFVVGFRLDLNLEKDFQFPKPINLDYKMQDFLIENSPMGAFLPNNDVNFIKKQKLTDAELNEKLDKYFLSDKIKKTILSGGTKNYYSKPETDLEIARPLLNTMHKMHRAGEDNYVTTNGKLRRLTPRECLRLMGFSDDWKIVVSDTAMYQQAGNSIVVDVLIHLIEEILKAYPSLNCDEN